MKDKIRIELDNPDDRATHIEVSFWYDKGGQRPFADYSDPRGYYVSVKPVTIEEAQDGVGFCKYKLFSGVKTLLEEAKRYNAKQAAVHMIGFHHQLDRRSGEIWDMIERFCEKEGFRLKIPAVSPFSVT